MTNTLIRISAPTLDSYKLLDSGNGQKLEEVASARIIRLEPRAWWQPTLPAEEWHKAEKQSELEDQTIEIAGLKARVKFSDTTKHIGIFPEQAEQWQWIRESITKAGRPINVLNLFGYTGLASLAAAQAGAKVTHIDGSRAAIGWARENQSLSGLDAAPIRWILDDALAFVKREVKRGEHYDAIILDPPAYGRGPKGEVWKAEEDLPKLLALCKEVLTSEPLFIILNMYSTELSSLSLANMLQDITASLGGTVEPGELTLPHAPSNRLLPLSISAIWMK